MQSLLLLAALFLATTPLQSQKTRFGENLPFPKKGVDYSLPIHLSAIRYRTACIGDVCNDFYSVDALVSGRKLELMCPLHVPTKREDLLLALGDQHGRLSKKVSDVALGDEYEILTPQGRTLRCEVSGVME